MRGGAFSYHDMEIPSKFFNANDVGYGIDNIALAKLIARARADGGG